MTSVFRKVMVAERLPKQGIGYFTDEGYLNYGYNEIEGRNIWTCYNDGYKEDPTWWLEEIQLPTEEGIYKTAEEEHKFNHRNIDEMSFILGFEDGAKHILNTLKGGTK